MASLDLEVSSNLEKMQSEFDKQKNIVDIALEESREYFSKSL